MISLTPTQIKFGLNAALMLLGVGITYTLIIGLYGFIEVPQSGAAIPQPAPSETRPQPVSSAPAARDASALINKNLFGVLAKSSLATVEQNEPTVATRLPLELRAVFVATSNQASAAIIAERGKKEKLYGVGDRLPGNAVLSAVEESRVILMRGTNRESLDFPKTRFNPKSFEPDLLDEPTDGVAAVDIGARPSPADTRPAVQTSSVEKPPAPPATPSKEKIEAAMNSVTETEFEAGPRGGYLVGGLANAPFFRQAGLQPSDIIHSINGQKVTDLRQDRAELQRVIAAGSARIELERGGRRFYITAQIPVF